GDPVFHSFLLVFFRDFDRPKAPGKKISKDIGALQIGDLAPCIDIPSGNRSPVFSAIFQEGQGEPLLIARGSGITMKSFHLVPSVIFSCTNNGDFFKTILANIPDDQSPLRVKGRAPRVSETEGEGLRRDLLVLTRKERIVF